MNHAQRIGSGFVTSPVVMVVLESLSLIAQWISAEKALYLNSSRNGHEGTSVCLMDVSDWHSPAIYVGYCSSKGGTHVRGRGWVTKSEAPTSYLINMVTCVIFGLLMIIGPFILHFLR